MSSELLDDASNFDKLRMAMESYAGACEDLARISDPRPVSPEDVNPGVIFRDVYFELPHELLKFETDVELRQFARRAVMERIIEAVDRMLTATESFLTVQTAIRTELAQEGIAEQLGVHPEEMANNGPKD